MSPNDPRHGQYRGAVAHWFDGERPCDDCARAEWRYRKTRKLRHLRGDAPMVASVGTVRRYQALMALGYTGPQIAAECGVSVNSLRSIGYHGSALIRRGTAVAVAEAYDRLCMTRPDGRYADRARSIAKSRGWLPPLAWDNIDDPNERPDLGRDSLLYRSDELAAEWAFLRRAGVSIHTAASQLGVSVGAIEKAIERAGRDVA